MPKKNAPGCNCCGSGSGNTITGCPCTGIPSSLTMTTNNPALNNGIFQNCTLTYQTTPTSVLPVVYTSSAYLSSLLHDSLLGADFYYLLTCYVGVYVLTRVYPTTIFGSPYRDTYRYTWVSSYPGNSCSPFELINGQIFSGGNTTQTVSITG